MREKRFDCYSSGWMPFGYKTTKGVGKRRNSDPADVRIRKTA